MISTLGMAAIGSIALYRFSGRDNQSEKTYASILKCVTIVGLGSSLGSYLGLTPNYSSAAFLSIKGGMSFRKTSEAYGGLFNQEYSVLGKVSDVSDVISVTSGVWGFVKHSAPFLVLSLVAKIASIYLKSRDLAHCCQTVQMRPLVFVPLALNVVFIGATVLGSPLLFSGAVLANLAWVAYNCTLDTILLKNF